MKTSRHSRPTDAASLDQAFHAITPDGQHCAHCAAPVAWEGVSLLCPNCGTLLLADVFPVSQAAPLISRVYLLSVGAQRHAVILTIRHYLQISLQKARAIVDSERPLLLEGMDDEVQPLVHTLQALGATI